MARLRKYSEELRERPSVSTSSPTKPLQDSESFRSKEETYRCFADREGDELGVARERGPT
jgi:hypothetical protein